MMTQFRVIAGPHEGLHWFSVCHAYNLRPGDCVSNSECSEVTFSVTSTIWTLDYETSIVEVEELGHFNRTRTYVRCEVCGTMITESWNSVQKNYVKAHQGTCQYNWKFRLLFRMNVGSIK